MLKVMLMLMLMLMQSFTQQTASTHAQHVFHITATNAASCNPHVGFYAIRHSSRPTRYL